MPSYPTENLNQKILTPENLMQATTFERKHQCCHEGSQAEKNEENGISLTTVNVFSINHNPDLKKDLKRYYSKIESFYSPTERTTILDKINCLKPNRETSGESHDMLSGTLPEAITFLSNHRMNIPHEIFSEYPSIRAIRDLYMASINRFAKILGLIGQHTITFKLIRLHNRNGKIYDGGWHYDIKASKTLVIMLKNDFHYLNGSKGLDIAFNGVQEPHDPNKSVGTFPKNNQYISVKYDDAIMLDNHKGNVAHRTPLLDPETLQKNPERIFIQIKLVDPDWK